MIYLHSKLSINMVLFTIYCLLAVFFIDDKKCSSNNNSISEILTEPTQNITTNFSDFIDIAAANGYRAEKHDVTTEDGYILTMHRIPPRKNCTRKTPMLVMHGLLQASECFIDSGPEAPGFVFSKDCYDVWFGNVRGNYHSRRHVRLNPDKDLEFWKFSTDEMGLYDIPAMIDHVLNATNSKKLIYVGFSQGGGTFFIMNSERPEYASKINLFIGLAPATRHLNSKSVPFRSETLSMNSLQTPLEAAGVWELMNVKGDPVSGTTSSLCQVELLASTTCEFGSSLLDSPHPDSITPEIVKRLTQHAPAGTSVQNLARYGQAMEKEKFTKFNYGAEENMKLYGSSDPPEYDLGLVKVPAVIYHGPADTIVDRKDMDWAVSRLPNVLEYIKMGDPLWNHLDMTYSRYWKDTMYGTMKKYLKQYDKYY